MQGRFTRLKLENWRNFRTVDVELANRVFVVGPNASGKSNLLDAFRFLQELAVDGGGLTNALEKSNRGGIRSVRSLHAGANPTITIAVSAEIDGSTWRYRLVLEATGSSQKPGPARIVEEIVDRDEENRLHRPNPDDKKDPELLFATALEQRSANAKFRSLRDFLRTVDYIHVIPQLVRAPAQGDSRRFGKGLGTGLIEAMGEVSKRTRDARLNRIQKGLRSVLPQFEKLEWMQDKKGVPHLRAKYNHWRKEGAWQREWAFSDGTLRLIGLLWFLDESGGPLLLEEPEMSLHAAAVRQLPSIVSNVTSRHARQVIMTSHSPDLLADKGVDPSELLILETTGSETTAKSGKAWPKLVDAAKADMPLSMYVEDITRPDEYANLGTFGTRP
ncbi:MAG: AAA family ATPase [Polyangiaceae bacterium]|nr:AAA family ATPase [Polyangiaceae bacterium]